MVRPLQIDDLWKSVKLRIFPEESDGFSGAARVVLSRVDNLIDITYDNYRAA